ncbi:MAG: type II toxin-antitoxin system PemK/MazF family toxin [Vicingaceae bacterium]
MSVKKGEVWNVNLNPVMGSEQSGYRPALIVSGDLLNTYSPVVFICPITSQLKNYKGNLIIVPNKSNGLSQKSEVLNLHLRSISKDRLIKKLGIVDKKDLAFVRTGIAEIIEMD